MSTILGVVLDLDDTLFLEVDYIRSGYAEVAELLGRRLGWDAEITKSQLWELFNGPERGKVFDRLLGPQRLSLIEECIQVFRAHNPRIALLPGVADLLTDLAEGHRLSLVTDGHAASQQLKVAALGLVGLVPVIIYSDRLGGRATWKPSPVPYLRAAELSALPPERCVYVGDNPHKDFKGARAAGMMSVRIRHPRGIHARCEPEGRDQRPTWEVRKLVEILRLVES